MLLLRCINFNILSELAGLDQSGESRKDRTNYNIDMVKKRFGNDELGTINFEQVFMSEMKVVDFEANSAAFEMETFDKIIN
jgi:hypothetical protein